MKRRTILMTIAIQIVDRDDGPVRSVAATPTTPTWPGLGRVELACPAYQTEEDEVESLYCDLGGEG